MSMLGICGGLLDLQITQRVLRRRMLNNITNHTHKIFVGLKQNIYIMKSEKNTLPAGGIKLSREAEEFWIRDYNLLISSGMAWEFHPWLTGNWNEDKERYINEIASKIAARYENTKD